MPLGYIAKRLFHLALIMFGVSVLVFLMLRMIPGDPARLLLGEFATPEDLVRLKTQMGLDESYPVQYGIYLKNLLHGGPGKFAAFRRAGGLRDRGAPARDHGTGGGRHADCLVLGIAAGVVSAARQYSVFDYGSMLMALVGVSMPIFWLGLMLIYLLSVKFPLMPMMGRIGMGSEPAVVTGLMLVDTLLQAEFGGFVHSLHYLVLPAFTLATVPMAIVARITRSAMLEVLNKDYVRTARAKGMSEAVVILRHALRNAFLPVVTVLGLNLGLFAGGRRADRNHFFLARPGALRGGLAHGRDYAAVQGCILIFAALMAGDQPRSSI